MFMIPLFLFVVVVIALIDIVTRPEDQVKHLPKMVWVLLVVFLPVIGTIVWFAAGREYGSWRSTASFPTMTTANRGTPPRRSDFGAYGVRDTEAELAALEREIEYNNTQARIDRLEAELNNRRDRPE